MPLITDTQPDYNPDLLHPLRPSHPTTYSHKQSQHSSLAKAFLMSRAPPTSADSTGDSRSVTGGEVAPVPSPATGHSGVDAPRSAPNPFVVSAKVQDGAANKADLKPAPSSMAPPPVPSGSGKDAHGIGHALSDTPFPSQPSSPRIPPLRSNSGSSTPRIRPTTLDIPGLTKSKISPDGRISQRDVGAKLVIVMVGLPARGKSYITKKLVRYLNWLQHDARIFNVGERRRVVAGGSGGGHRPSIAEGAPMSLRRQFQQQQIQPPQHPIQEHDDEDSNPHAAAQILLNGQPASETDQFRPARRRQGSKAEAEAFDQAYLEAKFPELTKVSTPDEQEDASQMDQSASFFDPNNKKAALIREQVALETLDELLDYILEQNGSVGVLDATNSTLERRQMVMNHIRKRAGELNVLFVESECQDQNLLETNMRLKLSGPDYRDKDPVAALEDFKKRVAIYEKNYVPLGEYEEKHNMPYVKMVDVGRKIISHRISGFLSAQAVYYLLNFNLAPRMIWISRHGESMDNVNGRIGGDSDLSPNGRKYAAAMARFIAQQRKVWEVRQREKMNNTHFPPRAGDHTPPNPHYASEEELEQGKPFCVWTSMLKRSIQCGEYFDDEEYDVKQMRMLDELNAGHMEGLTYEEIKKRFDYEFELRKRDKMAYRYPGPGGEGYLDVINRLRPVIVELERMTDHVLIITHRSVARVLLAYFQGLRRDEVADLDCPLGMLYCLEPKPYGVQFNAYRYNPDTDWFDHLPNYQLKRVEPESAQFRR